MGLLTGKVAVITGAGGGIGRAHALAFAHEGAAVVVNDLGGARDGTGGDSTMAAGVAAEIAGAGGTATASVDDVSERAGAHALVQTAIDTYGKLDVLVNNAGILRDKTLLKMDDDMFDAVVKVHLRGTFLCTQEAARHMKARGEGGRIINTSSVSGLRGNFGQANYAAAKAGIYGLTRTAAIELKRARITVNALAPIAMTRMTEDLPAMRAMANARELLSPEHVAPAALFLASELAADITGQVLAVEGPRMYLFKMIQTEPVNARGPGGWTPAEIRERWIELGGGKTSCASYRSMTTTPRSCSSFEGVASSPSGRVGWCSGICTRPRSLSRLRSSRRLISSMTHGSSIARHLVESSRNPASLHHPVSHARATPRK